MKRANIPELQNNCIHFERHGRTDNYRYGCLQVGCKEHVYRLQCFITVHKLLWSTYTDP